MNAVHSWFSRFGVGSEPGSILGHPMSDGIDTPQISSDRSQIFFRKALVVHIRHFWIKSPTVWRKAVADRSNYLLIRPSADACDRVGRNIRRCQLITTSFTVEYSSAALHAGLNRRS